jgi:hypothetical protein
MDISGAVVLWLDQQWFTLYFDTQGHMMRGAAVTAVQTSKAQPCSSKGQSPRPLQMCPCGCCTVAGTGTKT